MPEEKSKKIDPVVKFIGSNLAFGMLFGMLVGLYFRNLPLGFVLGLIFMLLLNSVFNKKKVAGHYHCPECGTKMIKGDKPPSGTPVATAPLPPPKPLLPQEPTFK
ncbi:MAG: hypothetical protein A2445_01465 [Candidatus Jacksonbacteria bacterium RIFOXYC2_FULL_44_29]|nr:MAG: hypothetical protein UR94_C0005G0020 [Parcubacteria group bacterium GW2011_GWA2_36_10]KKT54135.1 MAG: hypothetical protein UW45_C0018G0021 [Parcubacteria group bacterium GW2011_GWC2_44_22]OGY75392.1 MAG: hypothetical protein A2295_05945 [Candidatus Jacksonbacteria bacterium RIFOXYB2_FULL_44_15]OGY76929.1 MAG: hypothetical protein A2240_01850 [Candidatus Jacksonbacteria bacterium RIFOXYA2_FULL_43_12]OGY77462.1 MAG: hypothetical protein A2445_01465 [Candidatus Jacksonbacteria bacterium RI